MDAYDGVMPTLKWYGSTIDVVAEYQNLAELRADLTAEDPDERATAYGSVLQADLDVSEVLAQSPPVEKLVEAGLIPEDENKNQSDASESREKQVSLLEEIRDILKEDA